MGREQCVDKVNASTKATILMTSARLSTTKEMDGNHIPPGDAAQKNRINDCGGRVLDNENVEYDNTRTKDGGPASMIDNKDS